MAAPGAYFLRLGFGRFSSRNYPLSVRDSVKITSKSTLVHERDSRPGSLLEN